MKISELIKSSLDCSERGELKQAMLFACLAVDGTAKKMYPTVQGVGERYRKFIRENIDIIEFLFGGFNLEESVFPIKNSDGSIGKKFEDIIYEIFRCNLAHGNELPEGYGVDFKVDNNGVQIFSIDTNKGMTIPESTIYALGLPCVLAPVNSDQNIGCNSYYYCDRINHYVVDSWWGELERAREIIDFDSAIRVKIELSN